MNDWIGSFHFIRPGWLLLVPFGVGLWWLWRHSTDPLRGWRDQVDDDLLQAMTSGTDQRRSRTAPLLLARWMIAIVAIAGPTWREEPNPFAADAAPLMLLLKADASMEQSGTPPTPLERGRLKIADLAELRKGQPLGLIAYAGSAHLVLPPTQDTGVVAEMAAQISSEIMPQPGDRLDLAITRAGELLSREEAGGTLLVIADSVTTDQRAIVAAHQKAGAWPIRFLALRDDGSIQATADAVGGTTQQLTPNDADIHAIVKAAERSAVVGLAGRSRRWQEAGYWLVPLLALLVIGSFRRETISAPEDVV